MQCFVRQSLQRIFYQQKLDPLSNTYLLTFSISYEIEDALFFLPPAWAMLYFPIFLLQH